MQKLSKFKTKFFFPKKLTKINGRNNQGVITVHHRGGGHKQFFREISWKRTFTKGLVVNIEYVPNRSAEIAKICDIKKSLNKKIYSYILLSKGLNVFDVVNTHYFYKKEVLLRSGDASILSNFDVGDFIHGINFIGNSGGRVACSAGVFCQILQYSVEKKRRLRLPSGNQRIFSETNLGTFGSLSSSKKNQERLYKAGQRRWLGRRPHVRGVAMNPIDHPHGGGQGKTKGGRPSVTPQSRPTKGQPTRSKQKKNRLLVF